MAEYTKRPLLVISSGELGSDTSEIDRNLSSFLEYAALWKAIVLIDEADVFLESRLTGVGNRLEQNSLVAGIYMSHHLSFISGSHRSLAIVLKFSYDTSSTSKA